MTISRRNVLLGATASAALLPAAARAQTSDVVIGVIYPLSGASAQIGASWGSRMNDSLIPRTSADIREIAAEVMN